MKSLNNVDLDLLEVQLELESLGITIPGESERMDALSEPEHMDEPERIGVTSETDDTCEQEQEQEQESIGTLKNGIILLECLGVDEKGYKIYKAECPYCHEHFVDSRSRLSKRDHCGCQTYERKAKAQARGVAARLANKTKRPAYDPNHVPFEKAMSSEEKAGWSEYLNKTMKPGALALYADMPQSHREVLASLLAYERGKGFEVLEYLLKDLFIELLDLCQAQIIEFPTRGEIRRRIAYIGLWQRFKEGQTPEEIAYELCDDTWRIVDLLKRFQTELRDFQRRDTYGLNDWYGGERVLNMEIHEDSRVVL